MKDKNDTNLGHGSGNRFKNAVKTLFLLPVFFYQRFISPLFPARCRFYPTCSDYMVKAVKKHGIIKGSLLGTWRILRCNPFSKGGFDPVPEVFSKEYFSKTKKKKK